MSKTNKNRTTLQRWFFVVAMLVVVLALAQLACSGFYGESSEEIYMVNADGTGLIQLTDNSQEDRNASWSPDGSKIVFDSRYRWREYTSCNSSYGHPCSDIYMINNDGAGMIAMIDDGNHYVNPQWSPDGSKIAFEAHTYSQTDSDTDICIMDADGSNMINLTNTPTVNEWKMCWTPDGKISFYSDKVIYTINPDGSDLSAVVIEDVHIESYKWSPDGSKILFNSSSAPIYNMSRRYSESHVLVMNADGSDVRILFGVSRLDKYGQYYVAWAPDSGRLAFTR